MSEQLTAALDDISIQASKPKAAYQGPLIIELGDASVLTTGTGNRMSDTSVGMHTA